MLSLVSYRRRGLEADDERHRIDVMLSPDAGNAPSKDLTIGQPSESEQARVTSVLSEWDDLDEYLPRVNAPGSRIESYRETSPSGSTNVHSKASPCVLRHHSSSVGPGLPSAFSPPNMNRFDPIMEIVWPERFEGCPPSPLVSG